MSLIMRLRAWLRRSRRKRASRRQKATLREFVYLDEVSVYSLIASRLGSIAAEFTETETASLQGEIGGSVSGGAGIARGELSSRASTTHTHGSQVLRKSIVQTTFKELYELEVDSLAMRPASGDLKPPEMHSLDDLAAAAKTSVYDGWIVDPDDLVRGQLLEVEVQLEAEAIFRVRAVASALVEIVEGSSAMFWSDIRTYITQVEAVDRILEKLLAGLVPVRGCATDYLVVDLGGKECIVHRKLLTELEPTGLHAAHRLYVVGVAEEGLFWKDIRRILFSKARFRVLCRMAQDGLQSSWTPVKLAHVLESVVPGLASQIDAAGSGALTAMVGATGGEQEAGLRRQRVHDALVGYATLLADHYGHSITAHDLSQVGLPSERDLASFGSLKGRREAFDAIAAFVLDRFGIKREPLLLAQLREVALADAGLDLAGQARLLATSKDPPYFASSEDRFLDTEFVAIYW